MINMTTHGNQTQLTYVVPSRGLIGFSMDL